MRWRMSRVKSNSAQADTIEEAAYAGVHDYKT